MVNILFLKKFLTRFPLHCTSQFSYLSLNVLAALPSFILLHIIQMNIC